MLFRWFTLQTSSRNMLASAAWSVNVDHLPPASGNGFQGLDLSTINYTNRDTQASSKPGQMRTADPCFVEDSEDHFLIEERKPGRGGTECRHSTKLSLRTAVVAA